MAQNFGVTYHYFFTNRKPLRISYAFRCVRVRTYIYIYIFFVFPYTCIRIHMQWRGAALNGLHDNIQFQNYDTRHAYHRYLTKFDLQFLNYFFLEYIIDYFTNTRSWAKVILSIVLSPHTYVRTFPSAGCAEANFHVCWLIEQSERLIVRVIHRDIYCWVTSFASQSGPTSGRI